MKRLSAREYTAFPETPQQFDIKQEADLKLGDWPKGRFMSPQDVGNILSVHPETVRRWVRRGDLKAIRLPGKSSNRVLRIDEAEFVRFLEEGRWDESAKNHGYAVELENPTGMYATERRFSRLAQKIAMEHVDG